MWADLPLAVETGSVGAGDGEVAGLLLGAFSGEGWVPGDGCS